MWCSMHRRDGENKIRNADRAYRTQVDGNMCELKRDCLFMMSLGFLCDKHCINHVIDILARLHCIRYSFRFHGNICQEIRIIITDGLLRQLLCNGDYLRLDCLLRTTPNIYCIDSQATRHYFRPQNCLSPQISINKSVIKS